MGEPKDEIGSTSPSLWPFASLLASVGAFGGAVVTVMSERLSGIAAVGAIFVGLCLAVLFAYLLRCLGSFLARKLFEKERGGISRDGSKGRLAQILYASLVLWFALFDWVGYVVTHGLFKGN